MCKFNQHIDNINNLSIDQLEYLIDSFDDLALKYAQSKARTITKKQFSEKIYVRGLIEFTNHCKNNCYYCGIRCANKTAERYRLSKSQILDCCKHGYETGCRTFVLQGGEDAYFNDNVMCNIVADIRKKYPDCAITLSIGERSKDSYKKLFYAGANRYLLRHETANKKLYEQIHPSNMSFNNRLLCLDYLKEIGYQTGGGMMIGIPGQTARDLAKDLIFFKEFRPKMIGIGPFLTQKNTPFANEKSGSVKLTLFMLTLIRMLLPKTMLTSTTALATADKNGLIKGILSGANVVMPNLTPTNIKEKYALYDGKPTLHDCPKAMINQLKHDITKFGYKIVVDRGDYS